VDLVHLSLVLLAATAGGAINSIAGGGTLLTFPAIVWLGVSPLVANATSTVALWPAALGSMWGYRRALAGARSWAVRFALPSLLGGATGAWLLLHTAADDFARIVPFLVLGATVLFLIQAPVMRWLRSRRAEAAEVSAPVRDEPQTPVWTFLACQFAVGVYGGYFGAGIGILMLAVLGFMGLTNIHQMNGLKNWGGLCMNAVAAGMFAFSGIVNWPVAIAMAVGGLLGGYGGAHLAQRVGQQPVRRAIIVIGFASFVWLLLRSM
jgi:uncharacterized membrane protein YfcA